ncbi:unnamed protein product [Microthlaspi erraticum]|uniref:Uncharacterized protein n=1 Tax=Microthlaspi erraticum TaxID=1685480 RepID=A0A6D2J557_9BRAS|nr:unnamed protein product [Microthlaspi erraticum]
MFLLCDDIDTLLFFCLRLWRDVLPQCDPVLERLLLVMYHVYSKDIKPKNGGDGKSVQWKFVRTIWNDFVCGIVVLHRLVLVLRRKDCSFDDQLLSSAIAKCKQELKSLEDKLRSAKDVSEANGFAREVIESSVSHFWKSLFDGREATRVIRKRVLRDLFEPISGKTWDTEIRALTLYSPYILGKDFAKQELKNEAVRLGVGFSLHVAQLMFLLCDDIRSMLWFCYKLWRVVKREWNPNSPVVERLLRVIHHVYLKDIKPRNGVYRNDGSSVKLRLAGTTLHYFQFGVTSLDLLVMSLRGEGSFSDGRVCASMVEEDVKKIEEKLRRGEAVSEANGFRKEAIECSIYGLWESLFDKEAKEATQTLQMIKNEILGDLFLPLHNEVAPPP